MKCNAAGVVKEKQQQVLTMPANITLVWVLILDWMDLNSANDV